MKFLNWSVPALSLSALLGCVPSVERASENRAAPALLEVSPALPGTSAPHQAPLNADVKPAAQGDADVVGLSHGQIEAMFAAAYAQQPPLEDRQAVCLVMFRDEGGGWPRNPPPHALTSFAKWTGLPVLPGSNCAFDVYPFVIETGAKAMLYSIRVQAVARDGTVTFWGSATYGNLGANGAEFVLKWRGDRWHADPTGVSALS